MRWTLAAAVAALIGCASVIGIDDFDRGPAGECGVCDRRACAATGAACANDADCRALMMCVEQCVDRPACRFECEQRSPATASPLYRGADACRRTRCADACYGSRLLSSVDPACANVDRRCSAEIAACLANAECERRFSCVTANFSPSVRYFDPGVMQECEARLSLTGEGTSEFDSVLACFFTSGSTDATCPLTRVGDVDDPRLACLGQWVRAPGTATEPVRVTVDTMFAGGLRGISAPGVKVQPCPASDCGCSGGKTSYAGKVAISDATGRADLELPRGFDGCFRVTALDGQATIVPLTPPISAPPTDHRRVLVHTAAERRGLASRAGQPETASQVRATWLDCALLLPVKGVKFALEPAISAFVAYRDISGALTSEPDMNGLVIGAPAGKYTLVGSTGGRPLFRHPIVVEDSVITLVETIPLSFTMK